MCLLPHSARICFEGSRACRSSETGLPSLAKLLPAVDSEVIARARHTGKFLDDTKFTFDELLDELEAYRAASRSEFMGNAVRGARWLESDLGLYSARGQLIAATIPILYRSGLPASTPFETVGRQLHDVAREQGGILRVLAAAAGESPTIAMTIDYSPLGRLRLADRRTERYFRRRYEREFSLTSKLALLTLEGDLGTVAQVIKATESKHREAAFRAKLISLFHIVRSLDKLVKRFPVHGRQSGRVQSLLTGPAIIFKQEPYRRLRNLSMHYLVRGAAPDLTPEKQMFGVTDSLVGEPLDQVDARLNSIADQCSDLFAHW